MEIQYDSGADRGDRAGVAAAGDEGADGRGCSKRFAGQAVVDHVDLHLEPGDPSAFSAPTAPARARCSTSWPASCGWRGHGCSGARPSKSATTTSAAPACATRCACSNSSRRKRRSFARKMATAPKPRRCCAVSLPRPCNMRASAASAAASAAATCCARSSTSPTCCCSTTDQRFGHRDAGRAGIVSRPFRGCAGRRQPRPLFSRPYGRLPGGMEDGRLGPITLALQHLCAHASGGSTGACPRKQSRIFPPPPPAARPQRLTWKEQREMEALEPRSPSWKNQNFVCWTKSPRSAIIISVSGSLDPIDNILTRRWKRRWNVSSELSRSRRRGCARFVEPARCVRASFVEYNSVSSQKTGSRMPAVTSLSNAATSVEISPDAERCELCGTNLRRLIKRRTGFTLFLPGAADLFRRKATPAKRRTRCSAAACLSAVVGTAPAGRHLQATGLATTISRHHACNPGMTTCCAAGRRDVALAPGPPTPVARPAPLPGTEAPPPDDELLPTPWTKRRPSPPRRRRVPRLPALVAFMAMMALLVLWLVLLAGQPVWLTGLLPAPAVCWRRTADPASAPEKAAATLVPVELVAPTTAVATATELPPTPTVAVAPDLARTGRRAHRRAQPGSSRQSKVHDLRIGPHRGAAPRPGGECHRAVGRRHAGHRGVGRQRGARRTGGTRPAPARRRCGVRRQRARAAPATYTVQEGDSLWTISLELYGTPGPHRGSLRRQPRHPALNVAERGDGVTGAASREGQLTPWHSNFARRARLEVGRRAGDVPHVRPVDQCRLNRSPFRSASTSLMEQLWFCRVRRIAGSKFRTDPEGQGKRPPWAKITARPGTSASTWA